MDICRDAGPSFVPVRAPLVFPSASAAGSGLGGNLKSVGKDGGLVRGLLRWLALLGLVGIVRPVFSASRRGLRADSFGMPLVGFLPFPGERQ